MSSAQPQKPSPPAPPLWRQGYDALEEVVGPPLERWVGSDQFARGLGVVSQLRREFERHASRTTRHMLHRFNLPAGTDVTRLLTEIGELRKQVRQLTEQLEMQSQPTKRAPARTSAAKKGTSRTRRGA
jgi:hypothetical protein